ncbi:MAG: hypothetical protein PHV20_11675 [Bacteroidales bacterium]|nr:hypothetical protein [Bacteroidales bacterium]
MSSKFKRRTSLTTNELKTRKRASQLSQSEIVTFLVGFHYGTSRNYKHYYLFFIKQHLNSGVSYSRFIELVWVLILDQDEIQVGKFNFAG